MWLVLFSDMLFSDMLFSDVLFLSEVAVARALGRVPKIIGATCPSLALPPPTRNLHRLEMTLLGGIRNLGKLEIMIPLRNLNRMAAGSPAAGSPAGPPMMLLGTGTVLRILGSMARMMSGVILGVMRNGRPFANGKTRMTTRKSSRSL